MIRKWIVLPMAALTIVLGWMVSGTGKHNRASLAWAQDAGTAAERRTIFIQREPIRVIEEDPYSNFSGMAIDEERGEVYFSNDNERKGQSIETYRADFPASRSNRVTEPLRMIAGPNADLGDICAIAVSPEHNEIYKVSGEGNSELAVFSRDANGDVEPIRWLPTSHGAWGIFLERQFDELFVTIEHVNRVAVYERTAELTDDVVRFIQGPNTQLADPHGIYADAERNEIYVVNHGHWHHTEPGETFLQEGSIPPELIGKRLAYPDIVRQLTPSTGKFLPPSITVYPRTGHGDIEPLRVIQGSQTGLNVPLGIFLDTESNQLVVANAGADNILFFDADANGNVAPSRSIGGPSTELGGPTSVVIDRTRDEVWATNWDNHTATVYPRSADGDVEPLRVIRSAPKGSPRSGFGSPGTIAYHPKRKEILVPN